MQVEKPVQPAADSPAGMRAWPLIVALFFLGWTMIYVNRAVLSPLLPALESEWQLSKQELGLLSSAFFFTYLFAHVPAGILADRFGRKLVLVPGYLLQGLFFLWSGLAGGPAAFVAIRAGAGFTQGSYFSTQFAWTTEAVPRRWRVLGNMITNFGQPFGIALGYLAAGWLTFAPAGTKGAWRTPILITALITVALALAMAALLREPARGAPRPSLLGAVDVLKNRRIWAILAIEFCILYSFFVLVPWLPYYLEKTRGYSGEQARWLATVMPFVSVPAGILWARALDRVQNHKRYVDLLLLVSAFAMVAMVALPGTAGLVVGLGLYGISGKLIIDPIIIAALAGEVGPADRAKALGFVGFVASVAMVLAPWVTGLIGDLQGSLNGAFYLAAALHVVSWAIAQPLWRRG